MNASVPVRVSILASPDTTVSTIFGLHDILCSAGRDWRAVLEGEPGQGYFESRIVREMGQANPVRMANGGEVTALTELTPDYHPDVFCVLELTNIEPAHLAEHYAGLIGWMRDYHRRGGVIAAACTGTFLLAETGLLDGGRATTHWGFESTMKAYFPKVEMRIDEGILACGDGNRLITAGGGSFWLDLSLYLIARFVSQEEAVRVAKLHTIDWHANGQLPYQACAHRISKQDALVAKCQLWIAENYTSPSPIRHLLELCQLSERSLNRRFKSALGVTPIDYVINLRIEEAKQLLESTSLSLDVIAEQVGYQDKSFLGRKFVSKVGITPTQYRRRFGKAFSEI